MMHNSQQRDIKRDMNLALDHVLPDADRAALDTHIAGSPEDAALWTRLKTVDHLLGGEPILQAPPDFASKVMVAIAAAPAPTRARNRGFLGLFLIIGILVPLVSLGLIGLQHWLSDPAAITIALQQVVQFLNSAAQTFASLLQTLAAYTVETPILPALLTTLIPLVMVWGWLMWYTSLRRQQVVYRIPVRTA
jgi:anti-sigma factor RsiW